MRFPWILLLAVWSGLEPVCGDEAVTALREERQIIFRSGTRVMGRYQAEPGEFPRTDIPEIYRRGGYLHPLLTPSGRQVTDDFPANHVHHHGVWSPWTKTKFEGRYPDFWNMGEGKGRVEFVGLDRVGNDHGGAGMVARHRFVDLLAVPPKTALEETWEVRAMMRREPWPAYQWDWVSTQRCATASPLVLPEYHYGGLGLRGNWGWNGASNGFFLISGGETDRLKINAARSRWFWMGGPVDGGVAGIVILCHPGNLRFPQPMRLHPSEPFFCYAPQQLGAMEIRPGESYIARYRFLVMDGRPEAEELEALWKEYAEAH